MGRRAGAGRAALAVALVLGACGGETSSVERAPDAWTTYCGAWFEIEHPVDYLVRPSLASRTAEGYDSVFFDSPDGEVSLYVCSSQWGRECSDIQPDLETELVTESVEREIPDGLVRRRWIAARDGSYERLVDEHQLYDGAVRWVVGLRLAEEGHRERYGPLFERFESSLRQFAD